MLIQDLIPGFQRYLLFEKNLDPKYIKAVLASLRLLDTHADSKHLSYYTTEVIASFLHQMNEDRLWGAKSFRNHRQHLKTFFNFAVRKEYLKKNPVDKIDRPKLPARLPRCLSRPQTETLLSHVHCYPWRFRLEASRNVAIIYTFLFTGLRLNELLNLKTDQMNFETNLIFVENGKGKRDRIISLHPKLIPVLKAYCRKRNESLPPSQFFFTSVRTEKRLTQKNMYAIFKKLSNASGFKVTPHQLRHTFAKECTEKGLNLYLIKEMLGHSSVATTEIYLSVATESLSSAFGKIDMF